MCQSEGSEKHVVISVCLQDSLTGHCPDAGPGSTLGSASSWPLPLSWLALVAVLTHVFHLSGLQFANP